MTKNDLYLFRRDFIRKLLIFGTALMMSFMLFAVTGVLSHTVLADGINEKAASKLGGNMFNSVVLLSHGLGSAVEPISILFVEALISLAAKVFPEQLGQYTEHLGFMNNTTMSIFIVVLFALLKLPKSMMPTRIFGVAVGDLENKLMAAFNFALPFILFFGSAEAESDPSAISESTVTVGAPIALKIVICCFIGLGMLLSFLIMRTVTYAADILITSLAPIPFASLVIETTKTLLCFVIVLIAVFAPYLMIGIYVVMFIVCALLFRNAYVVSRYFRKIYVANFFTGKATKSRIAVDLKNKYDENDETSIECFAGMYLGHNIKKYSKCKLIVRKGNAYLSNRKLRKLDPDNNGELRLAYTAETPYKIRKGFRFTEIYIEDPSAAGKNGGFFRSKRKFSLIVSNYYGEFYNDLVRILGFEAVAAEEKKSAASYMRVI